MADVKKRFKKQLNYMCCLKTNIQDLKAAAEELEEKQADLHEGVDVAMVPIAPHRGAYEIPSRKQIEDDIIKAMRDGEVNVIGVCGMGGIGKTMMAKRIMNRARTKEGLFEEIVMVAVGQQADVLKIQRDIGDWLGMRSEEKTLERRANELRVRLMCGKRTLIIIDDIWERIDLGSLGIPCEGGLCKILLTSRDKCVLDNMDAKIFTVKELNEEEALLMFKENAMAASVEDSLLPIAKEIVKKCNGLPLAIVVVARALKGNLHELFWEDGKDALEQLRSGNSIDMPHVIKEVYDHVRLSYDLLKNENAKSLWFLCSSFPHDHYPDIEYLAFYKFGLRSFDDGNNNLKDMRKRIATLIKVLKGRFLILDGDDEHHVKMHDWVRNVAIFIASEEKHSILQFSSMSCWSRKNPQSQNCNMLSVVPKECITKPPMEFTVLMLQFLWMDDSEFRGFQLSGNFFDGVPELKVLYMKSFSFTSIPQTMQLLKNLRTLHLSNCESLKALSGIGELSSLEILIFHFCGSITELPVEIGKLNRLQVLEVTNCCNLKTIKPGVISNLVQLEELKMRKSFMGWESNKKGERSNASLQELKFLCYLRCLEIEIFEMKDWRLDLQLSSKIEKFKILVGQELWDVPVLERSLSLNFPMETLSPGLPEWIQEFARCAQSLSVKGGAYYYLNFLRNPVLENLFLESFPNLEEVFYGQIYTNSFGKQTKLELRNLRSVVIRKCGKLRSLFSSSVLIKSLSELHTLTIEDCDLMEEVFSMELEEEKDGVKTIMKLQILYLRNLPRLTTLFQGIRDISIEFQLLEDIEIKKCPNLISFTRHNTDHQFSNTTDLIFHTLWSHHIPHPFFGGLKTLEIVGCAKIHNLFSYSIADENLKNLKSLIISECNEMVYVIANAETSEKNPEIIFHKLEVLVLKSLPKLKNFCDESGESKWDLQFPSLTELNISHCYGILKKF